MTLYAESSAVIAWLLEQARGEAVRRALTEAESVVTSELALVEFDRALLRLISTSAMTPAAAASLRARLAATMHPWSVMPISTSVVDRARQPFPFDSIRALDALHLASVVVAQVTLGNIDVLSLDDRIRENASALGFRVLPA